LDRIVVVAQDATERRALAGAESIRVRLVVVHDDERRVVLDAGAPVERADEVVDLLTGGRRQSERFVERADLCDDGAANEDGEGDRPVPEVLACQDGCTGRPGRRPPGDAAKLRRLLE